jgi:biotin-(acetyl-CoA carboxylase) ligase
MAIDIDEKGALIVKTDSGQKKRSFSGDVVNSR